jgi:hypothetical protein
MNLWRTHGNVGCQPLIADYDLRMRISALELCPVMIGHRKDFE